MTREIDPEQVILTVVNDFEFYARSSLPTAITLAGHMRKGRYQPSKAQICWVKRARQAVVRHCQITNQPIPIAVPMQTKKQIAQGLSEHYEELVRDLAYP